MSIKKTLIENGVKNLKEYGYPSVNNENILTDIIYSQFFKSMLEDNKGFDAAVDAAINNLMAEIDEANQRKA